MRTLLDTSGRRLGSIFIPLILIGLGVLLFLQNAGLIQVSIWSFLWRLWPLIPVLVGIELLLGQRLPRVAILVMLLVSGGVITATALVPGAPDDFPVRWGLDSTKGATVSGEFHRIEEPLANVERAVVELRSGGGELHLSSLPASSPLLVAGDLTASSWRVRRRQGGERAEIEIVSGAGEFSFDSEDNAERWDLQLSPEIPIEMDVQARASEITLDLAQLQVPELQVKLGVAKAHLRLPASGYTSVTVEAGAAEVTIDIPADTPARIRTRGLMQIEIDKEAFPPADSSGVYQSPGFGSSLDNRIDLEVQGGLAHIVVNSVSLVGQDGQTESGGGG